MKPLVFLGSGVSLPTFKEAGSVGHLTECLFKDPWVRNACGEWRHGAATPTDGTPPCQEFLRRLRRYVGDYYSKVGGSSANYEDLFYLVEQMSEEMGWGDNAAVQPFRKIINAICAGLEVPTTDDTDEPFKGLLSDTLVFIQSVIAHELNTPDEPDGLDLLAGLANLPSDQQLTVCSLNHDLLVERFFEKKGISFTDGFSEKAVNGIRYFSRSVFQSADVQAKLLKLHGSINWWRFRPNDGGLGDDEIGIRVLPLDECKTSEGKRLLNMDATPHFLTGSYNKLASYQSGIYLAIMRAFDCALDQHDVVVMSGYGWGDNGINRRLKSWVWEKTGRQIIVLHEDRKQLSRFRPLLHQFTVLRKQRKLISVPEWMCGVDVKQFCHRLEKRVGLLSERSFAFRRSTSDNKVAEKSQGT